MLVVGLTGSIGMGKSTVAERFRQNGIPVIDADALVHELYRGEAVAPIEAAFPGTTGPDGVDRTKLAAELGRDPEKFKLIESIVHPLVFQAERDFLLEAEKSGAHMAVLEIPLLFETGGDARCDVTVVVSAPADVQRERVLERPGMTDERLDALLVRQMSDADKRARADHVIDTGQELDETLRAVDQLIESLKVRTNRDAGDGAIGGWRRPADT